MKIGIYFDSSISQGGIYHHNINLINIFKEYLPDEEALITSKKLEIAIKKISDLEEKIKNLKKS